MPSGVRSRVALLALTAIFLIPIGMSSLRGLTHILTCEEEVPTPFTVVIPQDGAPEILSSLLLEIDAEEGLCGGLVTDVQVGSTENDQAVMTLLVSNNTAYAWHGTVQLMLEGLALPVNIKGIQPGETADDTVTIRLQPGTHEIEGNLLIGP
jgi:hypothetical protein